MYVNGILKTLNEVLPEFKAGDKVYCPMLCPYILEVTRFDTKLFFVSFDNISIVFNKLGVCVSYPHAAPVIFEATAKNKRILSLLHPQVWFEEPN